LFWVTARSQSTNIPLNKDTYHWIDRFEIKKGTLNEEFQSEIKPYTRKAIGRFTDSLAIDESSYSLQDRANLRYLLEDNWEWASDARTKNLRGVWNALYKKRSDFFQYQDQQKIFQVHVNPVLYLSYGGESDRNLSTYTNTRGIQIRGMIDNKVGFYTFLGENQARFPGYVRDYILDKSVVPGEGFWKNFGTQGNDFFTATGYISFNVTKHINFQLGHDRQYWGNGYRSMVLSDFSPPSLFLKINTHIWKLNYTNLFTQVFADAFGRRGASISGTKFPKKYMVAHRLGMNIGKHVNLGIYEQVVFGREDLQGNNHFSLTYLNPIIFYRSVEQQNGSTDNSFLGIDAKWNFLNQFSLYGQWIFDELIIKEFINRTGWWGNKFGYQLGLKYIDAFRINNLDLQLEFNSARPYTYSHRSIYSSYDNYRQPLAHPLGANFKEFISIVRYQPLPKLSIYGKIIRTTYGLDTLGVNFGNDILKNYDTREQDFGNFTGQGVSTQLTFLDLVATYQLYHNLFIDLNTVYRKQTSELARFENESFIYSLALRWNIARRLQEF